MYLSSVQPFELNSLVFRDYEYSYDKYSLKVVISYFGFIVDLMNSGCGVHGFLKGISWVTKMNDYKG